MELDQKYASAVVRRYAAAKQSTDDILVERGGQTLHISDVYTVTEKDLAYRDCSVNERQKGRTDEIH